MNIQYQHVLGRRTIWMTSILFALALGTVACGDGDGGSGPGNGESKDPPTTEAPESFGDECADDEDLCSDGTDCRGYGNETDDRFCTMQCGNNDDCPEDSACLSLNSPEGLVQLCVPNELCIDPDEDGYGSGPGCKGPDCDQSNPNINPGAAEICDGLDNNCSGKVDDNPVDVNHPCDTPYVGVCAEGWTVCRDATIECEPNVMPNERQEICDGLDNDCDGLVDESDDEDSNFNYVMGIGKPCGNPDGTCFAGYQICNSDTKTMECDGEDPFKEGVLDFCTGKDDNCNGEIDEDANDPDNLLGTPCYAGIGTCRAAATYSCDPDDPEAEPICPAEERTENALPETCDYTDNDCDGVIDNGFVNLHGDYGGERVYDGIENCGQCGNNCITRIGGNPAALGLSVTCDVTGTQATCSSECLPGRYDLDQVPANGCEFEPDPDAIYVAKEIRDGTEGEDTASCGIFSAPCRSITHAIGRADSDNKARVRVAEGIFNEALTLQNGISVMGGHSSRNWELNPAANTTTLQGGITMGSHVATVIASNITSTTEFSGFTVDARDAQAGGNSYGIYIKDANDAFTVKDNIIIAGRGGVGAAGASGASGTSGGAGANGLDRQNSQPNCDGNPILAGGVGGTNSCNNVDTSGGKSVDITVCPNNTTNQAINNTSATGERGKGGDGGAGGVSGAHTARSPISAGVNICSSSASMPNAEPGREGGDGTLGTGGAGGSGNGTISSHHWYGPDGDDGGSGTHGSGGGGGGSSGGARESNARFHYGPTGGGGGAGGCGGNGGEAGHAGGASFGIFVAFSGNSSSVPTIEDNEITRGVGGRGGTGGAGGAGGDGGKGGDGGIMSAEPGNWSRCGTHGQPGGAGGGGGHGGGGGGGAGGASFAIATAGNSNSAVNAYQDANTYTQEDSEATGGLGGDGGESIANEGTAGAQGASGRFRRY